MQRIYNIGLVPRVTKPAERFTFPFSEINFLLNGGKLDRITLITSSSDNGKAQPIYSVIQTPYGEKKIGDIKVGDEICGTDGNPQKVLNVFPQGKKKIYRVHTSDGFYTDCVEDHIWTVIDRRDYPNKTVNLTTKQIIEKTKNYTKGYRYGLPEYSAIEYSKKDFPLDCYVLGAYLGDGCSTERQFSISSNDTFVVEKVAHRLNAEVHKRGGNNYTYTFTIKNENDKTNPQNLYYLTRNIVPKELLGHKSPDKFIPQEYFYGSVEQRLDLLRGLMDTDGHVNRCSHRNSINTIFSTSSLQLAKDICKLVQSLGFIAKYNIDKRYNRICNTQYAVNIRINKDINPFSLPRKANIWRPSTMFKYRKITKVEDLGFEEESVCIYVSNENHLYLTDNYIVTHNTTFTSQILCNIIEQGYKVCAFFGEDTATESQERIFKQSIKTNGKEEMLYVPYIANGKETNCGEWILTDEAWQRAYEKFNDKLFLYNTKASASVDEILKGFDEARTSYGCRVFLLDNVDQFDFDGENENKALKDIIIKVRDYAINNKVHIFLIAHIRKTERDVILPDMFDVKGTSSIVNIAKNVLILVRLDKVDRSSKAYKRLKAIVKLNNYDLDEADSLVYVAKTKGRRIGYACLKFNRKLGLFYDCKKIDENKKFEEKTTIYGPPPQEGLIPLSEKESQKLNKVFREAVHEDDLPY